jgi:hypothetical protein
MELTLPRNAKEDSNRMTKKIVMRLCDTYTPRVDFGELRFGLDSFDDPRKQSLTGLLAMPFVKFE